MHQVDLAELDGTVTDSDVEIVNSSEVESETKAQNSGFLTPKSSNGDDDGFWTAEEFISFVVAVVDVPDNPSRQDQNTLFGEMMDFIKNAPDSRRSQAVNTLAKQIYKFRSNQQKMLLDEWKSVGYDITLESHPGITAIPTIDRSNRSYQPPPPREPPASQQLVPKTLQSGSSNNLDPEIYGEGPFYRLLKGPRKRKIKDGEVPCHVYLHEAGCTFANMGQRHCRHGANCHFSFTHGVCAARLENGAMCGQANHTMLQHIAVIDLGTADRGRRHWEAVPKECIPVTKSNDIPYHNKWYETTFPISKDATSTAPLSN